MSLPLAAMVILISLWRVQESRSAAAKKLDILGALIVTIGLGGLVYGLIESARLGWQKPWVWGSMLLAVGCLTRFPFVETRGPSPTVPLYLFRSRTFTRANPLTLWVYSAGGIFFSIF